MQRFIQREILVERVIERKIEIVQDREEKLISPHFPMVLILGGTSFSSMRA